MSNGQNLIVRGTIKERVDKFDRKGNIKENDFDIIDIENVKVSFYTKNKVLKSTTCNKNGEYSFSVDAYAAKYYLKLEKTGYLPKISEMDLTDFTQNDILELNEWDFGIRRNKDNVTSSILNKPFERYYFDADAQELILDQDYGFEYQVEFAEAIFTQIEDIKKETIVAPETDEAFADAKEMLNKAIRRANLIAENARDYKEKAEAKNVKSETQNNLSDEEILRNKVRRQLQKDFDAKLETQKKELFASLKDSILELANTSIQTNNNQNTPTNEDENIESKKLELYSKRQQLEIDRLKALTKEDSLVIKLREQELNSAEAEILSAESRISATKAKLEAEHKELLLIEADNKNQRNIILIISLLVVLVLAVAIFIYRNLNEKKKTAEILEKQNEIIADKNDSILASIKYAKRIQDAILPRKELWEELLPNSSILFMPKDIVSGDFYWMHQIGINEVLFAAVDCTGHGVPGGFMSIVGYHSLHRSVNEFGFKKPSDILDSMQKSVNAVLRQGFGEGSVKDGMDMALCSLNTKTNVLQYSGAYNPLWIVRGDEIIEQSATKQAVGSFTQNSIPFENHEIQLEKGDIIYIFSDGYADQFGGPAGKKIMSRGLKKLILKNKDLELNKQKIQLKKHFYDWMNESDEEQVDDVCIIAVKV